MRWLAVVALAAGCARPRPAPAVDSAVRPTPIVVETPSPLAALLVGAGEVLLLPRERQAEEIEQLATGLAATDLPTDRLRLALLLVLGDPEVRDAARARGLLEGRAWSDTGYETLARLVLALADERGARAREVAELAAALEAERRKAEELAARLEAVKAIETEIHRDGGTDGGTEDPGR